VNKNEIFHIQGTAAISYDALISYFEEVKKAQDPELTPVELEQYKAYLQNRINENDFQY